MNSLRYDPYADSHIIMGGNHFSKPNDYKDGAPHQLCPFCRGNESMTPDDVFSVRNGSIPDKNGWNVRVVPNKYPILTNGSRRNVYSSDDPLFPFRPSYGFHEVIIETPEHRCAPADFSSSQIEHIITAYKNRIGALKKDPEIKYVQIFKNYRDEAGSSLEHPHSQIIAGNYVPGVIERFLLRAEALDKLHGCGCITCAEIEREINDGTRLLLENDLFLAFQPLASKIPYEIRIVPKNHNHDFHELADDEVADLALTLHIVYQSLHAELTDSPMNVILNTAPVNSGDRFPTLSDIFHWRIEILPRLSKFAGYELGTGDYVNSIRPEDTAPKLRGHIEKYICPIRRDHLHSTCYLS